MKIVKNISRYILCVVSILLSLLFISRVSIGKQIFADSPTEINYLQDLDDVRNNLTTDYILMRDLDFDDDSSYDQTDLDWATKKTAWTTGDGWEAIGYLEFVPPDNITPHGYAGTFDGQDYAISNLYTNQDGLLITAGLFGVVDDGTVQNLGVESVDVNIPVTVAMSGSGGFIGALFGESEIDNCYATGELIDSSLGQATAGGLIGGSGWEPTDDISISNSYSLVNIATNGDVGGLVGGYGSSTEVINSYYNYDTVLINGSNVFDYAAMEGDLFDSWLSNNKTFDSYFDSDNSYLLINSLAKFKLLRNFSTSCDHKFKLTTDIDLSGDADFYIASFCAELDGDNHEVSNLSLNYPGEDNIGLFGEILSTGTIKNIIVTNADVTGERIVAGLIGENFGTVTNSHTSGEITGGTDVGGLIGWNREGVVEDSSSQSDVILSTDDDVWDLAGGLIGYDSGGEIDNCHSSGTVDVTDKGWCGGFVGYTNSSTINNSYSTVTVTGYSQAGGFVSFNDYDTTISNSYATGEVSTTTGSTGGFVGYIRGSTITNSYATGDVTGTGSEVGGFSGRNREATISNSYSTGNIVNGGTNKGFNGSFVGWGINNDCFWDTDTSGQTTSNGGTGKTTAEMQTLSTFNDTDTEGLDEAWDILGINTFNPSDDTVWYIDSGNEYPLLYWQYDQPQITTPTVSSITTSSAKLSSSLTAVGTLGTVKVYFQYRPTGGTWMSTPKVTKTSTGTYNSTLSGLNPNSDYQYRAVVEYGSTITDYSSTQPFSTLKVDIPKVIITEIGLIRDILIRDRVLYYFTSTTPTIRGTAYPSSFVKFETESEEFITQADSQGDFEIELDLDTGTNELDYYAYNNFGSQSETRELTLIIGTGYFPEWLLERLGLLTPTEDIEEEEQEGIDQDEEETEEEETEQQSESNIKILTFLNERGDPLKSAYVKISGQEYYTDSNGEIRVVGLDWDKDYKVLVEYEGKTYETDILGSSESVERLTLTLKEEDISKEINWEKICLYVGISLVVLISLVLIFSKEKNENTL